MRRKSSLKHAVGVGISNGKSNFLLKASHFPSCSSLTVALWGWDQAGVHSVCRLSNTYLQVFHNNFVINLSCHILAGMMPELTAGFSLPLQDLCKAPKHFSPQTRSEQKKTLCRDTFCCHLWSCCSCPLIILSLCWSFIVQAATPHTHTQKDTQ